MLDVDEKTHCAITVAVYPNRIFPLPNCPYFGMAPNNEGVICVPFVYYISELEWMKDAERKGSVLVSFTGTVREATRDEFTAWNSAIREHLVQMHYHALTRPNAHLMTVQAGDPLPVLEKSIAYTDRASNRECIVRAKRIIDLFWYGDKLLIVFQGTQLMLGHAEP